MLLLFPQQAGLKQLEFISSDGVPLNVDKSIIALTLKRKTIWMKPRHSLRNFVALNSNCLRGKSSTLWQWHCLRKIALESKTPYPYLMNLVSNYLEKNILSDTVKKTIAFNQECHWNYGSKSLHYFWATPYSEKLACLLMHKMLFLQIPKCELWSNMACLLE